MLQYKYTQARAAGSELKPQYQPCRQVFNLQYQPCRQVLNLQYQPCRQVLKLQHQPCSRDIVSPTSSLMNQRAHKVRGHTDLD